MGVSKAAGSHHYVAQCEHCLGEQRQCDVYSATDTFVLLAQEGEVTAPHVTV